VNQNNTVLYLDDLVRGYRIDIWDSVTARWHALTRRDMSYVHDLYGTVLAPDSVSNGWFSNEGVVSTATSASADPTSNSDDIFVGETVAEWSGWSLVAPRPGKTLAADGSAAPVAQPSSRHPDLKLTVRAAVTPGTLPSLRFGRVYAARLRSADIVGGGPRLTDFSALATSGNASQAIRYARYEPLPPPEIVAGAPFVGGDSLTQLVLLHRNGVHPNPVTVPTVRYLLPPATTAGLAELHGGFDGVAAATSFTVMSQREGQRIGPASSPSWMPVPYTIARDLQSDPNSPSYFASKGPVVQPPYLVDKMVAGLRLVGRGVPETLLDFNPFGAEPWWNRRGWALTLRPVGVGTSVVVSTAASSTTRPRTVNFDLPIGQMFEVALSSTPDGFRLNHLAGYNQVANGSAPNKATLLTDIARGRNIRVSPPTRLKLVHAVQIPLIEPVINAPITITRSPHGTTADFTGAWFADRYSTGRLDIELHWSEPNDTQPNGPVQTTGAGHLPPIQIPYPEPGTLNSPQGFGALSFQFGDTRHRAVKVSATATSRYASYFSRTKVVTLSTVGTPLLVAGETGIQPMTERVSGVVANPSPINGWTDLDTLERDVHYTINWTTGRIAAVAGSTAVGRQVKVAFTPLPISRSTTAANTRTVHVKASAPPVTPRIAEIVPVFSDGRWGPYPNAMTATGVQRNRNGRVLRVYLERPWFSSGDNEMLGVVLMRSATTTAGAYTGVVAPTTANAGPLSVEQRVTSAWGRDPLVDGVAVAQRLTVASFPLATDAPGHGRWAVDRQAAGLLVHTVVVPHAVQFDSARKQWFSDIALDLGAAYRPFVRLALCRFQPYAMPGMFMSDIELVDTAQLSPERTLIVAGSGNTRTITLHGPAYLQRAVGLVAGEAAQSPPAVRPGPLVTVQLQRRSGGVNVPSTDPDVGWVDVRAAAVMALSPTARIGNRQEFVAKNFNVGVNASDQCRIVVREYESETKDQFSPTPRTRMVWADSYRLR
jgi:hypothetical protein